MSYNLRYANEHDGNDRWVERDEDVLALIQQYKPVVLGIQEGLHEQVVFLENGLAGYERIGVGRDDGATKGEHAAILFDSGILQLLSTETFWLSETPEQVSVGWDAAMERVCTFGHFKFRSSSQEVVVFNAHFDHIGNMARLNSSELLLKQAEPFIQKGIPIVVMGDLNAEPNSPPIQTIIEVFGDPLLMTSLKGPIGTWNGFDATSAMERRIDYIFLRNATVESYQHIDDRRPNGRMPSDHLPVLMKADL
ncbi:MAG: endonuclease/exonuclease/phosphatase family protein [Bacteroidota bacterium]